MSSKTLVPVDSLIVDVIMDNVSDNYSSKPAHVSSEFANVISAGACELSGETLCCAQLGLSLLLTVSANGTQHNFFLMPVLKVIFSFAMLKH
jgi:7,8-dihydropterin-6-yl-methyl-4-(beta-D-ribofuranosyl)aminobenzene 5'-phosphate synthase